MGVEMKSQKPRRRAAEAPAGAPAAFLGNPLTPRWIAVTRVNRIALYADSSTAHICYQMCTDVNNCEKAWLPGQDSNLQPCGYERPILSDGLGLSHHPWGCRALRPPRSREEDYGLSA